MAEASSGLQGAADRIRETAKWLTVSLAAVGGVLVAGSQLSDIGKLQPGSDRLLLAILGGGVAAMGSALILLTTTWTATAPAISLHDLAGESPPAGTERALRDEVLLGGRPNASALESAYSQAIADRNQRYAEYMAAPTAETRAAAEYADADAVSINADVDAVLKVASYERLAHRWRWARVWILLGGALGAAGIGVFAWAANPPTDAVASVVTPGVLTKPTKGTITLTEDSRVVLQPAIGAGCALAKPLDVMVLKTTDAGPDVVVQQENCEKIRFILVTDWGTLQ